MSATVPDAGPSGDRPIFRQPWTWVIDIHLDENGAYRWRLWSRDGRPAGASPDDYAARANAQRHARPERRARNALEVLPGGYDGHAPARYEWAEFCDDLATTLDAEGVLLGLNWTGESMTGYDVPVDDVKAAVQAARES